MTDYSHDSRSPDYVDPDEKFNRYFEALDLELSIDLTESTARYYFNNDYDIDSAVESILEDYEKGELE